MSASEKLKALPVPTPTENPYASCPACDEYDFPLAAALVDAHPQIVAVVEAAEKSVQWMSVTSSMGIEDARVLWDALRDLDGALS